MEHFICVDCGTSYDVKEQLWRCPCGGLFNLVKQTGHLDAEQIRQNDPSMWRYLDVLPFDRSATSWKLVTMGEGWTPLIQLDESCPYTYVKVDYMMPTLSFKDRGAAVLIAKAKELGVNELIADSSGNAGTSIAAYARRAGISCTIFLSDDTSPKKVAQIKAHGARIRRIKGDREAVAQAAKQAVMDSHIFYASHVYNPYFFEGTKTYAYEIWEQLPQLPDALIIPVGNGTLLLGVYYGFKELLDARIITRLPKIIAVQAANCSPLANAFYTTNTEANIAENFGTLAEGIAIAAPARSRQILEAVHESQGHFITVNEGDILEAREALASKGFYVEPTTAANYAGYLKYAHQKDETIVIPLCGAGIKAN